MRVDILGPLRVTSDGLVVASPMAKERALLEALALDPGRTVPLAVLEAALWGDDPPATAARSLQAHVARLRHDLGAAAVIRDPGGYRLAIAPEDVDASRAGLLVAAGEAAWRDGDAAAAREWFQRADALWRGEPLADLADTPERQAQVDRLAELQQQAREGRLRADLALGRHREVLPELRRMAVDRPAHEPVCALLMLAEYRSGNPWGALRAYARIRRELREQWGVEPSAELLHLQGQVLRQDPQLALDPPSPPFRVPAPTSRFVGRQGQAESVAEALARTRLVTLHGPAGVGKSRLAVRVAEQVRSRFPDGTWWVDLTSCADDDCVVRRIVETIGIPASPGLPLVDWLGSRLGPRHLLVILDNCEHVHGPVAGALTVLLAAAPRLHVLATSRVRLAVPGEVVWEAPPLQVPAPGTTDEGILACDSVELFLDRLGPAPAVPGVRHVGTLCRALDGIPLALELIAAQAGHATPAELVERLPEELGRVSQAAAWPPHHASVRTAIEWSCAKLPETTLLLLERLSVAPADLDLDAIRALAAGAGLAPGDVAAHVDRLVDASLLQAVRSGERTRFRLLFVIREYAAGRLRERGGTRDAERAFADHFRDLCARVGPALEGPGCGPLLQQLHAEMINLRTAVAWSLAHDPVGRTLDFSHALGRVVWASSPDLAADAALLRSIVDRADAAPVGDRAWGWLSVVTAAYLAGDVGEALAACTRAETLFRAAGDERGPAVLQWHWGAALLLAVGDLAEAERHLRLGCAIARGADVPTAEAWCLAHLVQLAYFAGRVTPESDRFQARAEELAAPEDAQLQAHLAMNRCGLRYARGELAAAVIAGRETEAYARRVGIPVYEQAALDLLDRALVGLGRRDEARLTSLRAARLALDAGNMMQLGIALLDLADGADADDPTRAARLFGAGASRAPLWPGFWPAGFPVNARHTLADGFAQAAAEGARLSAEEALELAIG